MKKISEFDELSFFELFVYSLDKCGCTDFDFAHLESSFNEYLLTGYFSDFIPSSNIDRNVDGMPSLEKGLYYTIGRGISEFGNKERQVLVHLTDSKRKDIEKIYISELKERVLKFTKEYIDIIDFEKENEGIRVKKNNLKDSFNLFSGMQDDTLVTLDMISDGVIVSNDYKEETDTQKIISFTDPLDKEFIRLSNVHFRKVSLIGASYVIEQYKTKMNKNREFLMGSTIYTSDFSTLDKDYLRRLAKGRKEDDLIESTTEKPSVYLLK